MALLSETKPGNTVYIKKMTAEGKLGQRLMDLGLYPDLEVKMIRNAPLEDPMEIEINGYHLSLRHGEAEYVEIV
ncbi:MAG: ferrous iron transport protein A [Thermodesulfobacteriota bacterium]|nr:ferrous iron transport protein A [Thermodesulfobacteriota bacterium]